MNYLTILTPSYNRGHCLPRLYESLKRQTNRQFEWLLVDDGSVDDTEDLVKEWQKEEQVKLRYLRKENGGKHTALNMGIAVIEAELTFIVDSDDWLPEDAVETILRYHGRFKGKKDICGYSFLRFYPNGTVNEAFFPEDEKVDTYVNVRINGNIGGDKAEVFFTQVLKRYPFPVFGKERFLPEDLVWVEMSGPYKMVHINACIYISEYLEGGLTKSGRKMKLHSPRGMMARSWAYLEDPSVNFKTKLKMALLYDIYRQAAGASQLAQSEKARRHWLLTLCKLPGAILYQGWKRKYSE